MPLSPDDHSRLLKLSLETRKRSLDIVYQSGSGHVGTCLGQSDILALLYGQIMNFDPQNLGSPERDRFVLSKGHGGLGWCALFGALGILSDHDLSRFGESGFHLGMHMDHTKVEGLEVSTGSLGHGIGMAVGMALGARVQKQSWHTYCLISDGECYEGSIWEAVMSASGFALGRLTLIIDRNGLTMDGFTEQEMPLEPLAEKLRAFGWEAVEVDGHDLQALNEALLTASKKPDNTPPSAIIAKTIKGKGVPFMENQARWHYGALDSAKYEQARSILDKGHELRREALALEKEGS